MRTATNFGESLGWMRRSAGRRVEVMVPPREQPIPKSSKGWLKEIAEAYVDARGVNSWSRVTGVDVGDDDLFHLAPSVCLKFRGLKLSGRKAKKATEAALAS